MSISMCNLKRQYEHYKSEIDQAVLASLASGHYVLGENVAAFEQAAADYLGTRYALGVASGTDALMLALRAIGINAGDEVITTDFTFIGTAEAISYVGAKPVFVDIDPETYNIDVNQIQQAITRKTRAIIVVHMFGQAVDMSPVKSLCQRYDLKLIEDCAHAFGASYKNERLGSIGDVAAFSFYPSKNLGTCGDGGLVASSNADYIDSVRALRNHGLQQPPVHSLLGYNSRLDDMQAAILLIKLKYIDQFNARRRAVACRYNHLLADADLVLPIEKEDSDCIYHQYAIRSAQRDRLIHALQQAEISYGIYYALGLHEQPVYQAQYSGRCFPVTEQVTREILCLPICSEISDEEVSTVAQVILNT